MKKIIAMLTLTLLVASIAASALAWDYYRATDYPTYVRTGPGLDYKSLGVLHRGDDTRYLHETAIDERGVLWYKIRWNGQSAWVSSRYTKKVRY